jgi:nucleotide-binding universal stress UspA family protein
MPTVSRAQLEAMPGFDPAFHLGEQPEPVAPPQATGADEKHFMADVVKLAKRLGWRVYHTHNSRRSEPGFPDLVLARPKIITGPYAMSAARVIFAELKTETGKVEPAQQEWLDVLQAVAENAGNNGRNVEVYLWRPSMWPEIERVLKGEAP